MIRLRESTSVGEVGPCAVESRSRYSLLPTQASFGRVAGFDPVLFAALVFVGILVTHGRQLTDDPRRGVSVEVRAVGDYFGGFVGQEVADRAEERLKRQLERVADRPRRARSAPSDNAR